MSWVVDDLAQGSGEELGTLNNSDILLVVLLEVIDDVLAVLATVREACLPDGVGLPIGDHA